MKKILLSIFSCILLSSCGYSSLSEYAKASLGSHIKASGSIDAKDPATSIAVIDEFYDYLQNSLHFILDANAHSSVHIRLANSQFVPLYYDDLGYARSYKAIVKLEFTIKDQDSQIDKKIIAQGHYVFNSNAISTLSDDERSSAIIRASRAAMSEFATKLGALHE